ncbi:hypothetical protein [Kitasatospora sp. NPDC085464]|uniref:hypothetical protein n=1 Tax=Kitasatospora sp. NPDC085464 TaxID=3364063 RepID=UPI0037C55CD6
MTGPTPRHSPAVWMLELVLSGVVLGESAVGLRQQLVEVVRHASGAADVSAGVVQHSILGLRSDS